MMDIINLNTVAIVIALLIGITVAWWIFRRPAARKPDSAASARTAHEGGTVIDEGAAATADVLGQVLGAEVHAELPGASGPPDNLRMLKGVGPKLAQKLNELGITRFDQLASLNNAQIAALDVKMEPFRGRIVRDRLVEQAGFLARGDIEGFEKTFGNLGSGAGTTTGG